MDYDKDETHLGFDGVISLAQITDVSDDLWEIERRNGDSDGEWPAPDGD